MEKKDNFIINIFALLLVVYGSSINLHLMLSMLMSFIITLVLWGLSDKDMIENTLMDKEPTEEMLEKHTSVIRIMFIIFVVMTVVIYNWIVKCN